ncbi:MAG: alpha/beta hydrolase [Asgard group archaeon]|nr:alpha/beta hydrolase [Asgard group archaeon]
MVSLRARLFIIIMRLMSMKDEGILNVEENRKNLENRVFLFRKPKNVKVEQVSIEGISGEWLFPPKSYKDCAIIYLHGGSYNAGSLNTHRGIAARIGKTSEIPVLCLDYSLAPENPFPAGLEDVITAYKWLIDQKGIKSNKIIIAGDSAGGGLALATLIKLREETISLPAAAVCLSPWTDLALTGDSVETKTKEEIMATKIELQQSAEIYLKGTDSKNPLASPLYADLEGLPPLLLQTGTEEIILDDTTRFAEKAIKAKVDVTADIWPGMWHVFQIFGNLMPESKKAIKKIGEFIRNILF